MRLRQHSVQKNYSAIVYALVIYFIGIILLINAVNGSISRWFDHEFNRNYTAQEKSDIFDDKPLINQLFKPELPPKEV